MSGGVISTLRTGSEVSVMHCYFCRTDIAFWHLNKAVFTGQEAPAAVPVEELAPTQHIAKKRKKGCTTDSELAKIEMLLDQPPDEASRFCAMLADHVRRCPSHLVGELNVRLLQTAVEYSRMGQGQF